MKYNNSAKAILERLENNFRRSEVKLKEAQRLAEKHSKTDEREKFLRNLDVYKTLYKNDEKVLREFKDEIANIDSKNLRTKFTVSFILNSYTSYVDYNLPAEENISRIQNAVESGWIWDISDIGTVEKVEYINDSEELPR